MSAIDRVSADTGASGATPNVPSIRLGVHFGPGEGKRFLNVEYPFDGTPEDFDRAFELCRVAFHERAGASVRPCGYEGPWAQKSWEASETLASVKSVCPSCELPAALVDDGQGLGLLICANCREVADILDRTPHSQWPGNDLPFGEAMRQSLKDWMRLCHRELLRCDLCGKSLLDCEGGDLGGT